MEALQNPRKRVDSAREYYPLIATGKALLRSTGTTLHKIAAHPERSEPNHHRWDRHQWGNVFADRVAGDHPLHPVPRGWNGANVHSFRVDARRVLIYTTEFLPLAWVEPNRERHTLLVQSPLDYIWER